MCLLSEGAQNCFLLGLLFNIFSQSGYFLGTLLPVHSGKQQTYDFKNNGIQDGLLKKIILLFPIIEGLSSKPLYSVPIFNILKMV